MTILMQGNANTIRKNHKVHSYLMTGCASSKKRIITIMRNPTTSQVNPSTITCHYKIHIRIAHRPIDTALCLLNLFTRYLHDEVVTKGRRISFCPSFDSEFPNSFKYTTTTAQDSLEHIYLRF